MPEIIDTSSDDALMRMTTFVRLALANASGQELAPKQHRPVAAIMIESVHVLDAEPIEHTFMVNWEQFAQLQGQIQAWKELLPRRRQREHERIAAEVQRKSRTQFAAAAEQLRRVDDE